MGQTQQHWIHNWESEGKSRTPSDGISSHLSCVGVLQLIPFPDIQLNQAPPQWIDSVPRVSRGQHEGEKMSSMKIHPEQQSATQLNQKLGITWLSHWGKMIKNHLLRWVFHSFKYYITRTLRPVSDLLPKIQRSANCQAAWMLVTPSPEPALSPAMTPSWCNVHWSMAEPPNQSIKHCSHSSRFLSPPLLWSRSGSGTLLWLYQYLFSRVGKLDQTGSKFEMLAMFEVSRTSPTIRSRCLAIVHIYLHNFTQIFGNWFIWCLLQLQWHTNVTSMSGPPTTKSSRPAVSTPARVFFTRNQRFDL